MNDIKQKPELAKFPPRHPALTQNPRNRFRNQRHRSTLPRIKARTMARARARATAKAKAQVKGKSQARARLAAAFQSFSET
jgi:hypothetical protein